MTRPYSTFAPRVARVMLLVATVTLALPPLPALGEPIGPIRATAPIVQAIPLGSVDTTVAESAASLTPDTFAIRLDDPYRFTAKVKVAEGVDSVQMRFKVFNPTGRLMIQKTFIDSDVEDGEASAVFERETNDLGLTPGSYPIDLEIQIAKDGAVAEKTLESELLVYKPTDDEVPVVFALRVSGQPLSDAQGRFVADPAQFTRARDDARAVAAWVLRRPGARVTLGISPLLLEEWRRISQGYVLTGPEGEADVPATSAVPLAYAEALDQIERALATGRLELVALGYADPDLSDLAENELTDDVSAQYAQGLSTTFAALEATPSAGTVSAGGCVPPSAVGELVREGIEYVVVDQRCARSGTATPTAGAYLVKGSDLVALVADARAKRAVANGNPDALAHVVFRRLTAGSSAAMVIRAQIGPGELSVDNVIGMAEAIEAQPWARLALGREIAEKRPRKSVRLTDGDGSKGTPLGYWEDVRAGREWAAALRAAVPSAKSTAAAQRDSLIAECSAWAGPTGEWALADRGRAYALHAVRLAKAVFDPVSLKVSAVTLAGSHGEVPVIISNDSDTTLALRLEAQPSGGVKIDGKRSTRVDVLPKDNFFEIPVDLQNALSGKLSVKVVSGDTVIDEQTVTLSASYLDRLVMIAGVVLVLGIMLAFVIRRVRAAEQLDRESSEAEK